MIRKIGKNRIWTSLSEFDLFQKASGIFKGLKHRFKSCYAASFVCVFVQVKQRRKKKKRKIQLTVVEEVCTSFVRALKFHFERLIQCKQTACCKKKESKKMQKLCNTISLRYLMFLLSTYISSHFSKSTVYNAKLCWSY